MKKFMLGTIAILCTITGGLLFAADDDTYILSENELQAVNKIGEIYIKKFETRGEKYKEELIFSLDNVVGKLERGSKNYEILYALVEMLKTGTKKDDTITNKIPEETANNGENTIDNSEQNNDGKIIVGGDTTQNYDENLKVNFSKIRETWVGWQNEVRGGLGLTNYYLDTNKLQNTAEEWAKTLLSRGELDSDSVHKRDLSDTYYDYNKIATWLKDRGVSCKNNSRYTFSESVAWTSYYCSPNETDCTYEFIDGLRKSFDRYMEERERSENSRPHYNAIVSSYFKRQGMGIAVKDNGNGNYEVFITTHYCTELTE